MTPSVSSRARTPRNRRRAEPDLLAQFLNGQAPLTCQGAKDSDVELVQRAGFHLKILICRMILPRAGILTILFAKNHPTRQASFPKQNRTLRNAK